MSYDPYYGFGSVHRDEHPPARLGRPRRDRKCNRSQRRARRANRR